jgi:sugar lactone lactonase YvrE
MQSRFVSHVLISLLLAGCQPASLMPQLGTTPGANPAPGAMPGSVDTPANLVSDNGSPATSLADTLRPVSVALTFPMEAYANLQAELNRGAASSDLTPESLDNLSVLIDGRQVDVRRLDFSKPTINPDGTITTTMTVFELTPEEADGILTAQAEALVDIQEAVESAASMSIQATASTQSAVAVAKTKLQQAQTQPTSRTRAVTTTTTTTATAKPTAAPVTSPTPTPTATPTPTKTPGAAQTAIPTPTPTPAPVGRPTPTPAPNAQPTPFAAPPGTPTSLLSATQLQQMTLQDLRNRQAYFEFQFNEVPKTIQTLQNDLKRGVASDKAYFEKRIQSLQRTVLQAKVTLDAILSVLTSKEDAARREAPPAAHSLATSAQNLKVQTPNQKVVMETAVSRPTPGAPQPPPVAVTMTTTASAVITRQLQAEHQPTVTPDPQLVDLVAKRLTQASGSSTGTPMLAQPIVVAAVQIATQAAITKTPVTALAANTALVPSSGGGTTVVPVPTLTTVSPAFGPIGGGTTVTLTGTNFNGATGATFGGVAGTALTVNSATSITVTTPATTVGAKDVVVTTPIGSVTLTSGFNFLSGAVSTLAGSTQGDVDGTGTAAKFNFATGIAVDSLGNAYVSDQATSKIRKITPGGDVTTFAGSTPGDADGTGTAAQFKSPYGVAVDAADNVYVADTGNHRIRKITPAGVVTTLAGSTQGHADGTGTAAKFSDPQGVASDASGNIYVADSGNHRIRKITPAGDVTTLAGQPTGGFAEGTGAAAQFNLPFGIAVDSSGNVFVADFHNSKIRKITPGGDVTTFAGSTHGLADGTGTAAQFGNLYGISIDASGNLYVVDRTNHKIRKVTPAAVVTTLAGSTIGDADGTSTTAQFNEPWGVAVGANGIVYVADTVNRKVRKIQ